MSVVIVGLNRSSPHAWVRRGFLVLPAPERVAESDVGADREVNLYDSSLQVTHHPSFLTVLQYIMLLVDAIFIRLSMPSLENFVADHIYFDDGHFQKLCEISRMTRAT